MRLTSFISIALLTLLAGNTAPAAVKTTPGAGSYAVVVSQKTFDDKDWRPVVDALVKKHQASTIVYSDSVDEARPKLAEIFPRYACFIARPEEAGRKFVIAVHRLTRALNDDPYPDVIWGILTGYDPADALRIATHDKPLLITRGGGGTGIDLGAFEQGIWFSESEKGAKWVKLPGQEGKQKCNDDSTADIVEMLNTFKPQIFVTSGHATYRDWQIGYSYKNGQFRCKDGQLFGLSLDGKTHLINSPEPKVYLPCGNCLIGQIPDRQAMALAWMHTGGAYQLAGYTVSTFFGYMGWGIRDYFVGQGGRFTFAEAFIANSALLVHQLETKFPKIARANIDEYDIERDQRVISRVAQKIGATKQEEIGLLWDRDTVAFYGDPAWEARLGQTRKAAWTQTLTEAGGKWTLELKTESKGDWGPRPIVQFFPQRLKNAKLLEGADLKPVLAETFILVPLSGAFEAGKTVKVTFTTQQARP